MFGVFDYQKVFDTVFHDVTFIKFIYVVTLTVIITLCILISSFSFFFFLQSIPIESLSISYIYNINYMLLKTAKSVQRSIPGRCGTKIQQH